MAKNRDKGEIAVHCRVSLRLGFVILLHAHSIVDGLGLNLYVGLIVVDFYFKLSRVELAQKVFDGLPEKDMVLWNTMISGLVRNCYYADSIRVFGDMVVGGMGFDSTTLAAVLPAVAELQELKAGMGEIAVHCRD
ncbi:pentatricopeptide repeat-containing protein At4g30700-like [Pyrus communis]|uniref:pentatricopeptide repeat-containing protein At4g30700-like n=1 Tax=Pyrus communis TaxID=23211 RepID=UPI0035C2434E